MNINCPKCKVQTKPFKQEADLVFDRCESCHGMWMDKGELARTAGDTHDFLDHEKAMSGPKTEYDCPKCPPVSKLHEIAYAPNTKLIVEVCKACEGLWLDSRELVQIQGILRKHRIEEKKKRVQSL